MAAKRALWECHSLTVLMPAQDSKKSQQPSTCTSAHRVCIVQASEPDSQPNELHEALDCSLCRPFKRPVMLP